MHLANSEHKYCCWWSQREDVRQNKTNICPDWEHYVIFLLSSAVTGKACLALCLAGVRVGRRAHSSFFSPTTTLPASYFSRNTRTLALHRPTHVSTRTHGSLQHHNHFKVRVETMGFIKRLLSMGSKKGKKSKREQLGGMPYEQTAHAATQGDLLDRKKEEEEQEAKASRLLRSSSAHFAVVSEVDYTSLPPIRAHNRLTFPLSFG